MLFVWAALWIQELDPSNNMAYILGPKLGLEEEKTEFFYTTLMNLSIVTVILGSLFAGVVQQQKRRPVLLICIIL